MINKYYRTKKKTEAYALNFLGHSFYKFDDNGTVFYSFVNSDDLQLKIKILEMLKYDFK